jgi:hypothetical protein
MCVCVCVALVIQHAMCVRYICHLWSVRLCSIFPHYLTNGKIFGKKIELSAVQSTQKHNTLTLAYSDLLHATTCFGHLL